MGQTNHQLLTATEIVWRVLKDQKLRLQCACCFCFVFFFNIQNEVFNVQGAWHSLNTLPTKVHGQVQPPPPPSHGPTPPSKGLPYAPPVAELSSSVAFITGNLHQYPETSRMYIIIFFKYKSKRDGKNLLKNRKHIKLSLYLKNLHILLLLVVK